MNSARVAQTAASDFFIARLEDKGDGELIIRKLKSRENTSENGKIQLKYDIAEMRLETEEE